MDGVGEAVCHDSARLRERIGHSPALLVAVLALVLSACGGGTTKSGTASTSGPATVPAASSAPEPSPPIDLATADACGLVPQAELDAVVGRPVPFTVNQPFTLGIASGTVCTHADAEISLSEDSAEGDWTIGCSVGVLTYSTDQGSVESRLGHGWTDISDQVGAPAVANPRTNDPVLIKDPRHFVVVLCRQRADPTASQSNLPEKAVAIMKLLAPRVR